MHDGIRHSRTARAVKWEGVGQSSGELGVKCIAQEPTGAVLSGLDRCLPKAQQFSGFFDTKVLNVAHHEYDAEWLWQVINGSLDKTAYLPLSRRALRIGIHGHQRKRNDLRLVELDHVDCRSPAAYACERFVEGDTREPGGQVRVTAEGSEIAESVDIGLLNDVLRFVIIADDGTGATIEATVVALHDDAKGAFVPLNGHADEVCILQCVQISDLSMRRISRLHGPAPFDGSPIGCASWEKVPALGSPSKADRRHELMAHLWLIAKQTEHAARDHCGLRLVDASAGHASMNALNDNGDAVGPQRCFQGVGNLRGHSFLNLEPLGKSIYDPSEL